MAGWQAVMDGREQLHRPLVISATGHACLAGAVLVATLLRSPGVIWGEAGSDGAATLRLVSSASIPLPAPTVATRNRVATENPGLHTPEPPKPQPKPAAKTPPLRPPEEKAVELPGRNAKVVPESAKKPQVPQKEEPPRARQEIVSTGKAPPREEARLRKPAEETRLGNEIPYGQGGPVQGPYGVFQSEAGSGGFRVLGQAGDFGTRYSWYVAAIRNRISSNWLKGTVDPNIRVAPRVYVTFQILRDGRIVNPQVTASSGISSLDRSALRAVYDSNPMPPLPGDYPSPNVAVEFWFDFRR